MQGTSSTTNQPSMDYVRKLIFMCRAIAQPVVYIIFCLVTRQKSPQQDFVTYLQSLPSTTADNFHDITSVLRRLPPSQKKTMRNNPDGSKWDIPLLFVGIKLACEVVSPIDHSAWSSEGTQLENLLYMIKQLYNDSNHLARAISESEFMNLVRKLCETLDGTIQKASLRYELSTTYCKELIQMVHEGVEHIISGDLPKPIFLPPTSLNLNTAGHFTSHESNPHYGIKIIKIIHTISQPLVYKIFCLGTPKKPLQQDFPTYLQSLSDKFSLPKIRNTFTKTNIRLMSENLDGSKWGIPLLYQCIKLGCEGLAPFNDPVWIDKGTQLENCLYRVRNQRNDAMHSSLEGSRLEFLDKVDEMRQTFIDMLNAAQLRYQEYMTTGQRDQLIQQVLVLLDRIKQRDHSEDVLPPITASQPTNTPGPAITASQPTNTPGHAITASQPTNTPGHAITTSQPTNTPGHAITASHPTNTPGPTITASQPTNTPGPAITASQPTNTPGPAITASHPTNTPGPATTASQPNNTPLPASQPIQTLGLASQSIQTPLPAITAGQLIDLQGTPSMTDQLSEYYGLKLIKMHWLVFQPCMYRILCLGTQMKPSDKNFIEYLKDLPQPSITNPSQPSIVESKNSSTACITQPIYNVQPLTPPNYKPGSQKIFDGQQKRKIGTDLDGKYFDIALLHPCIKLGCVGVAALDDPAWISEGTELENCLYMIKKERNDVMHETLKLSESQFLERVRKLREIVHNTLIATQHRYVHSMSLSECNQCIQKEDNNMDVIRDERLGIDELRKHCLPALMQMFIPEAIHELKENLKGHKFLTMLDFVKSCDSKEMCLKIQNIHTRVKMVKGKEQASRTHMDYRKLLTWIQAKAKASAKDKDQEEFMLEEEEKEQQQEEEEEDEQSEGKPQMLILEGSAGMGKTSLIMLMINEWLDGVEGTMEESVKGTIEGLDYYDLVLKIHCRDSHLTSFEDLLKHYMNKTFCKYRNLLPCLTKECRLLIIIDGYDERNSSSRNLIEDVLLHLKHSNKSTLLCTTRPEYLVDFIKIVPSEYENNMVELTGIPVDLRAEFMKKYFQEIKRVKGSNKSGQELVDKVEREKHKEHYNVPLNLAILAWLFYYQSEKINDVSSQTELYYHTHQMLKNKLDDRLAKHDLTKNYDKWEREEKVEEWLPEFYLKTFLTLSDNILNFDKPIIKDLRSACRRLKLPPTEVLGAFLTLKNTTECASNLEQYSIAHKGLHDNYAALHILKTFKNKPNTTIIATMEKTLGVNKVNLKLYLNMFKHLAGLLDLEISNPSKDLVMEIVELIEKAGESSQDAWLDIIEEVKISQVFLKAVTSYFPIQDGIVVKEIRAAVYSKLLPLLRSAQVIVDIRSDPTSLLQGLTCHTCTRVELWHHWYHPNNSTITIFSQLLHLLSCDSLRVFRGHGIVELVSLPASLKELMIAIPEDNQARSLLPLLMTQQMHLQHLEVHVTAKVSTEAITSQLPDVTTVFGFPGVSLILSNVKEGEEHWACQVAAKLQPSKGYWRLEFPRSTMTADGWRQIIEGLHKEGVKVHLLWVPNCSTTQEHRLDDLASNTLGAILERMDFTAWEQ